MIWLWLIAGVGRAKKVNFSTRLRISCQTTIAVRHMWPNIRRTPGFGGQSESKWSYLYAHRRPCARDSTSSAPALQRNADLPDRDGRIHL